MADPQALSKLLQEFLNDQYGQGVIIREAVVIWEVVNYEGEELMSNINYATLTEGACISGTVGLLRAGELIVLRDTLGDER